MGGMFMFHIFECLHIKNINIINITIAIGKFQKQMLVFPQYLLDLKNIKKYTTANALA